MSLSLLKPDVGSFGYALFLAITASAIWGGSLPFLPSEIQTVDILTDLFLVQALTFWLSLLVCMAIVYYFFALTTKARKAHKASNAHIVSFTLALVIGSLCLIAPQYLPRWASLLVLCGGILLGVGTTGFFLLWQRIFASQTPERGNLDLILGTAYSPLVYIVLNLIPMAIAALCIALILIPLSGFCLLLASRNIDYEQAMFQANPRDKTRSYVRALTSQWRNALCVGSVGFACGIARAIALQNPSTGQIVNIIAMAAAFVSALAIIFLWQRYSFGFDIMNSFRIGFPIITSLFLLLPLLGDSYLRLFAGLIYMLFAFATMIAMIQCAQVSRDFGVHPFFIFGFFGAVMYGLQNIGFLTGYLTVPLATFGMLRLALIALLALWLLAITLFLVRGLVRHPDACSRTSAHSDNGEKRYHDRLEKLLVSVATRYHLTTRESEIAYLIARGNSVAHIAEQLVVSENTIRTHSKRIYTKLGIHKRQGLLDLLNEDNSHKKDQ